METSLDRVLAHLTELWSTALSIAEDCKRHADDEFFVAHNDVDALSTSARDTYLALKCFSSAPDPIQLAPLEKTARITSAALSDLISFQKLVSQPTSSYNHTFNSSFGYSSGGSGTSSHSGSRNNSAVGPDPSIDVPTFCQRMVRHTKGFKGVIGSLGRVNGMEDWGRVNPKALATPHRETLRVRTRLDGTPGSQSGSSVPSSPYQATVEEVPDEGEDEDMHMVEHVHWSPPSNSAHEFQPEHTRAKSNPNRRPRVVSTNQEDSDPPPPPQLIVQRPTDPSLLDPLISAPAIDSDPAPPQRTTSQRRRRRTSTPHSPLGPSSRRRESAYYDDSTARHDTPHDPHPPTSINAHSHRSPSSHSRLEHAAATELDEQIRTTKAEIEYRMKEMRLAEIKLEQERQREREAATAGGRSPRPRAAELARLSPPSETDAYRDRRSSNGRSGHSRSAQSIDVGNGSVSTGNPASVYPVGGARSLNPGGSTRRRERAATAGRAERPRSAVFGNSAAAEAAVRGRDPFRDYDTYEATAVATAAAADDGDDGNWSCVAEAGRGPRTAAGGGGRTRSDSLRVPHSDLAGLRGSRSAHTSPRHAPMDSFPHREAREPHSVGGRGLRETRDATFGADPRRSGPSVLQHSHPHSHAHGHGHAHAHAHGGAPRERRGSAAFGSPPPRDAGYRFDDFPPARDEDMFGAPGGDFPLFGPPEPAFPPGHPTSPETLFSNMFRGGAGPFGAPPGPDAPGAGAGRSRPASGIFAGTPLSPPLSQFMDDEYDAYGACAGPAPGVLKRRLPVTLEELCFGKRRKIGVKRKRWDGRNREFVDEVVWMEDVLVERGMRDGDCIKIPGEGDVLGVPGERGEGLRRGDLWLYIREKKHPTFIRDGDDLHLDIKIPLIDALCGWARDVTTVCRKNITVRHPGPTGSDWTGVYPGLGMPKSPDVDSDRGDLIVGVKIVMPPRLDDWQRDKIRRVLKGESTAP